MKKTRINFDNAIVELSTEESPSYIFDTIREVTNAEYEDLDTYTYIRAFDTNVDHVETEESYTLIYLVINDKKNNIIKNKSIKINKVRIKVILK